ncbi:MAG: tyrosine-type recombinase/integrase [Desulfobulbaceae bacterium]|jgi:integrase|nr:tyrosine-type recombinase/integrase [Desulfobulbaceae bacterium]
MPTTKINFSDHRLLKLTHDGSKKRLYFYDSGQAALALCITPTGTKSFQLQTWDKARGRSVAKTIGKYPAMSINTARELVRDMLVDINKGEDVIGIARKKREEECLDDVFKRWLDDYSKQHKKSWKHDETRYYKYISKPFGKKRVSDLDRDSVRQWFLNLTKIVIRPGEKVSKTTANRIFALLRTIFNHELPDIPNPCKGIKTYQEYSRDRFLQPSELKQFFSALESEDTPGYFRNYVLLSLLTGARKSNILAMKWADIDFDRKTWTIPGDEIKNKSTLTVPLVEEAMEILLTRKASRDSIFVFPSPGTCKSKTGHYVEPQDCWERLVERSGLKDIHIHDLRRTMGSFQTMGGASLTIVGKSLGHKSTQATQVYARLDLDPVRASMEKAVEMMMTTKKIPDKRITTIYK